MITLDCTFRDGGYQNNWDFDIALVNQYLKIMEDSKVDAIEIGFRSEKDIGIFGNVTDDFILKKLNVPIIKYFGVMINTAELDQSSIPTWFNYEDVSSINLVRLATHFEDINKAEYPCKELKYLGYTVTINLMRVANKSYDEIVKAVDIINNWDCVDVLYLADSYGGMSHDHIDYAFSAVKAIWEGQIGFHAHNNKGQALNNSLEAIDIGVDWIDGTMMGIGRGAGNTEIEYLLLELNKRGYGEYNLDDVFEFALGPFLSMKDKYEWGPNILYYLVAENNIHPMIVQKMIANKDEPKEILRRLFE